MYFLSPDGLEGLSDLDDVWSIRKNVSLGGGPKTANTSSIPAVNASLTSNTGFYSRHGQLNGRNNGTSAQNYGISPTGSPSGFQGMCRCIMHSPSSGQ